MTTPPRDLLISFRRSEEAGSETIDAIVFDPNRPAVAAYNPTVYATQRNIDGSNRFMRRGCGSFDWTFLPDDPEFRAQFDAALARFLSGERDPFGEAIKLFARL